MRDKKVIKRALISVYHKDGLDKILYLLKKNNVEIISTGGTQKYIQDCGYDCTAVEDFTSYPSILGGRVKTLHPSIMGGILARRGEKDDERQCEMYQIPHIDLVIVDLYPFKETLQSGGTHDEIIEKIDIGGVSLIRAASKNYKDVLVCPSRAQYGELEELLKEGVETSLEQRLYFASKGFTISATYDSEIMNYMLSLEKDIPSIEEVSKITTLRYGENPHQKGEFVGDLDAFFEQLHGKELSYNNLLDVDAAVGLIDEFKGDVAFAILKHNNPCGLAISDSVKSAYLKALEGDPLSAFGGILITNSKVDKEAAEEIGKLFFEVIIAPAYSGEAMEILEQKKNRIILRRKDDTKLRERLHRACLNGELRQDRDVSTQTKEDLRLATNEEASNDAVLNDLIFANKIVKHCKSNAIVFAKNGQLYASGVGQTSRIDALKQAAEKAKGFGFDLQGSVLASDAFFPFSDCVEEAHKEGVVSIVQPGGSIRDQESVDACNKYKMSMYFTGVRHFKH